MYCPPTPVVEKLEYTNAKKCTRSKSRMHLTEGKEGSGEGKRGHISWTGIQTLVHVCKRTLILLIY